MIVQIEDVERLVIIHLIQVVFCLVFLFIAIKILKRHKNRLTWSLSSFYILNGVGFIFAIGRLFFRVNPGMYILYSIALYLIFLSMIFLVLFNINLFKLDNELSTKKLMLIILFYAILIFSILCVPNGFTVSEETNWFPVWSWTFLIIIYIFTAIVIVLPFTYYFFKIYKTFEDKKLKRKLILFFIGFLGIALGWYGGTLYNTWDNSIYRTIWPPIALINALLSGCLIYYTWGREI